MSRAVPFNRTAKKQQARRRTQRTTGQARPAPRPDRRDRPNPIRSLFTTWFLGKLLALAILGAGGWAIWYGVEAPELTVNRVTVSGNDLVPTPDITDELDVHGSNIFQARRAQLARMVRVRPAVRDVEIQLRFPDHIHIVVRERTPVAIWDTGGRRMLVDADGVVPREGDGMLPIIVVHDAPVPELGDRIDPEAVRIAQEIGPRLDALGLGEAQFDYRPSSGMTLISRDRRVALGFADNLDAKLDAYKAIRDHLVQTHTVAELVDVRFLDRPYFR